MINRTARPPPRPMGYLNPFLYAHAHDMDMFTDITVGSNKRDRSGTPWRVQQAVQYDESSLLQFYAKSSGVCQAFFLVNRPTF